MGNHDFCTSSHNPANPAAKADFFEVQFEVQPLHPVLHRFLRPRIAPREEPQVTPARSARATAPPDLRGPALDPPKHWA